MYKTNLLNVLRGRSTLSLEYVFQHIELCLEYFTEQSIVLWWLGDVLKCRGPKHLEAILVRDLWIFRRLHQCIAAKMFPHKE